MRIDHCARPLVHAGGAAGMADGLTVIAGEGDPILVTDAVRPRRQLMACGRRRSYPDVTSGTLKLAHVRLRLRGRRVNPLRIASENRADYSFQGHLTQTVKSTFDRTGHGCQAIIPPPDLGATNRQRLGGTVEIG